MEQLDIINERRVSVEGRLEANIRDGGRLFRTHWSIQDGCVVHELGSIDDEGNAELALIKSPNSIMPPSKPKEVVISGLTLQGVKRQSAPLLRRFVACDYSKIDTEDILVFEDARGEKVKTRGMVTYLSSDNFHPNW